MEVLALVDLRIVARGEHTNNEIKNIAAAFLYLTQLSAWAVEASVDVDLTIVVSCVHKEWQHN